MPTGQARSVRGEACTAGVGGKSPAVGGRWQVAAATHYGTNVPASLDILRYIYVYT